MKKPYPCHLPGKELWSVHFESFAAAELTPAALRKELAPLWKLAAKKKWMDQETLEKWEENCAKKQIAGIWDKTMGWNQRIQWHIHEESPAGAGWILLKTLNRAHQKWKTYRKPFIGLQTPTLDDFRNAIRLADCFEAALQPQHRLKERHLLGFTIFTLNALKQIDISAIGREAIGPASIDATNGFKTLCISHGMPSSDEKQWIEPRIEIVRMLSARFEKHLPETQKTEITWLRSRPS